MTDHSTRRRHIGAALIAAGALALPLTASIVYARSEPPVAPEPPSPPAPIAPVAPPAPPVPPVAPDEVTAVKTADGKDRIERRRVIVVHQRDGERADTGGNGKPSEGVRHIIFKGPEGTVLSPDDPKFKEKMKDLEEKLAKMDTAFAGRMVFDEKRMAMWAERSREMAERSGKMAAEVARLAPRFDINCDGTGDVSETRSEDGRKVIRICQTKLTGAAASRLRVARAAIAGSEEISADTRRELVEKLDAEIARMENRTQS